MTANWLRPKSPPGWRTCRWKPIPGISMRRWIDRPTWLALLAAVATTALVIAARAAPIAVEVVNASEPTLCAEKDNVYLQLRSAEVRQFTVVAEHPAYAGTIVADRSAPDFRNCDM